MKWTQKPITWGAYLKMCAVVYAISIIVTAVWVFWSRIERRFNSMYERIERLWNQKKDREP